MVKTYRESRFVLMSLSDIRDCKDIVLQTEDSKINFDNGQKCYLCEVISSYYYKNERTEKDLISEICKLNTEKRNLEKKIRRLENALARCKNE